MSKPPVGPWAQDGNCFGVDPNLMVPEDGAGTTEAKTICQGCSVQAECLDYALMHPRERFGVWGGTSERERRRMERSNRRRKLSA